MLDCHVHMLLDGGCWKDAIDRHRDQPDEAAVRAVLADYRDRGYSWLRDGGDRWGAGELAARLAPEYGIEYRTPCFPIYREGHYGSFIGRSFDTLEDFRSLVLEVRERGGHFIKLMFSGLMDFSHYGVLTDEPMPKALAVELTKIAHDAGFAVMVHANGDAAVAAAIEAEADSVEHGAYLSEEVLCQLAESDTVWVPTLATIANLLHDGRFSDAVIEPLLAFQMNAVRFAAAQGASIAVGSDAGAYNVFHGQGGLDEAALLHQAIGDGAAAVLEIGGEILRFKF